MADLADKLRHARSRAHDLLCGLHHLTGQWPFGLVVVKQHPEAELMFPSISGHPVLVNLSRPCKQAVNRLVRRFPDHPQLFWDKMDKNATSAFVQNAGTLIESLEQGYCQLEKLATFQDECSRLLGELNQWMTPGTADQLEDGPQGLLHLWMGVLCDCIKLHLLGQRAPHRLLVQLYTCAHAAARGVDPRHRPQLCNFILTFEADPLEVLANEFGQQLPRVRQALEHVLCPVLKGISSSVEVCRKGAFRPGAETPAIAGLSEDALWQCLACLKEMKEFVLWGCLLFPGVVSSPLVRDVVGRLLKGVVSLPLCRDTCEAILPLYNRRVRPFLEEQCRALSNNICCKEQRDGVKREFAAFLAGLSSAATSWKDLHNANRIAVAGQIRTLTECLKARPIELPAQAPKCLAALSCSRDEVLMYFRHEGAKKASRAPALAHTHAATPANLPPELGVSALISAMVDMRRLLLSYKTTITAHWVNRIKDTVVNLRASLTRLGSKIDCKLNGDAATEGVLERLVMQLERLEMDGHSCNANSDAEHSANGGTPADLETKWKDMLSIIDDGRILATHMLKEELTEDKSLLHQLRQVATWGMLYGDFGASVRLASSLHDLCFYCSQLRSLLHTTVSAPSPHCGHAVAMLHVPRDFLNSFSLNVALGAGKENLSRVASCCAEGLLQILVARLKALLGETIDGMAHSTRSEKRHRVSVHSSNKGVASHELPPSGHSNVNNPSSAAGNQAELPRDAVARLWNVAAAMANMGPVPVNEEYVLVPGEYMREALAEVLRSKILDITFSGQNLRRPTQVASEVHRYLQLVSTLQRVIPFDILAPVHRVLTSLSHVPTATVPPGSPHPQPLISTIAEWFAARVIDDVGGLGIKFRPLHQDFMDAARREAGLDVVAYTSLPQLRALIQVYGTHAVVELQRRWRTSMAECLSSFEALLVEAEPQLGEVIRLCDEGRGGQAQAQLIAQRMRGLPRVGLVAGRLARCLGLRYLLMRAFLYECAGNSSVLCAAVDAFPAGDAGGHTRWGLELSWASRLLRAGDAKLLDPLAPDPGMVDIFSGSSAYLREWPNIVALLACASSLSMSAVQANERSGNGRSMDEVNFVVGAMSAAIEQTCKALEEPSLGTAQGDHVDGSSGDCATSGHGEASCLSSAYTSEPKAGCRSTAAEVRECFERVQHSLGMANRDLRSSGSVGMGYRS